MTIVLVVAFVLAVALAMASLDVLVRRPAIATWLVLALVVIGALLDTRLISAEIGGFTVSPADVGFSLLAAAAVLRFLSIRHTSPPQRALLLLGAMSVASLLLGVTEGPVEGAVNEFRIYLGFVGAGLYFSTVAIDVKTREAMTRAWFGAGVGLAAIVALRWVGRVGGLDLGIVDASFNPATRVLNGPVALFVASTALVLLLPRLEGRGSNRRRERQMGIVLLVMAVLLFFRTLWLALAVLLIVLLLRNRRIGLQVTKIAVAGLVLVAVALPLLPGAVGGEEPVTQSATDTRNFVWRLEGWQALLESGPDEPGEYILGLPFGSGYVRTVAGSETTSSPHNFYLRTFLRTGIIGLGALLAALWLSFIALLRSPHDDTGPLSNSHLVLLLVLQSVWFLTWPPGAEQGIILGLAVAAATKDHWQRRSLMPSSQVKKAIADDREHRQRFV